MMNSMKQDISQMIMRALEDMGLEEGVTPQVTVPENPEHGDYSTNIAMLLSKQLKKSSREIADQIKEAIQKYQKTSDAGIIERVEVAGPGFINMYLSEANLISQVSEVLKKGKDYGSKLKAGKKGSSVVSYQSSKAEKQGKKVGKKGGQYAGKTPTTLIPLNSQNIPRKYAARELLDRQNASDQEVLLQEFIPESPRKKIMVEFAHPNTHKAFHIGHLRNITTGESIVRLLESQGHEVIRANYQGDVGMHIAKALYALIELSPYKDQVASIEGIHERVEFLGKAYAAGSKAFEDSDDAKKEIGRINKLIYDRDPQVYALYRETRQWSLDYFDSIYKRLYSHFDRLYFESEIYETGKEKVLEGIKRGIFEKSDGAIIFPGKKYGLDVRVFITGEGNTTYEGKEIGLSAIETTEFGSLDRLIHVVGPEQQSFFKVTFKAEELMGIVSPGLQYHLVYGWVRLKKGKMSSRLGNVVLGEWLLDEAKNAIYKILEKTTSIYSQKQKDDIAEKAAIAAVKYSFLRVGVSGDIAFDIEASVSFEGDSGPYLQYTYARCQSVIRRASLGNLSDLGTLSKSPEKLNPDERVLARSISQFPDVVAEAAQKFAPNTICTYLFHLAQEFNLFYAKNPILGSDTRLVLTAATAQVLKNGLYLLGIEVPEQM
jgi:arginyl-tRNA synthetase